MDFHIYGENAFTFLFFREALKGDGLSKVLLPNLKSFETGKRHKVPPAPSARPQVWLFPSFGKRYGFGEPDALVEVDRRLYWFEVESKVDLRESECVAPLRQLYRFHCAARAFSQGATPRHHRGKSRLSVAGPTITDDDRRKDAVLDLKAHEVARRLRPVLRSASESHYVLLSVRKPRGGVEGWQQTLATAARKMFEHWGRIVGLPRDDRVPVDRCWYVYLRGDLSRWISAEPLSAYVHIKGA